MTNAEGTVTAFKRRMGRRETIRLREAMKAAGVAIYAQASAASGPAGAKRDAHEPSAAGARVVDAEYRKTG